MPPQAAEALVVTDTLTCVQPTVPDSLLLVEVERLLAAALYCLNSTNAPLVGTLLVIIQAVITYWVFGSIGNASVGSEPVVGPLRRKVVIVAVAEVVGLLNFIDAVPPWKVEVSKPAVADTPDGIAQP